MKFIVTAGPTNERIDSVMKITNMSTGKTGAAIANKLMEQYGNSIDTLYYVCSSLARRPDTEKYSNIKCIVIESTEDLLNMMQMLLTHEHIDGVVHSAAVGDYKAAYSVRAEDLVKEILELKNVTYTSLMGIFENPSCAADDTGKMSSYEPHLMTMLTLTPKVIGMIKKASPDTALVGFKLLDGVSDTELKSVATKLLKKNNADYIVANDLSRIDHDKGKHFAMIIGKNGNVHECQTEDEIAEAVSKLVYEAAKGYRN